MCQCLLWFWKGNLRKVWSFGLDGGASWDFLNKMVFSYCSFHQIMLGIHEQVSEGVLELQHGVSAQNHRAIG